MKNYWLKKKGFPQDDELSGCCGDFACNCSANLDVFYAQQFFQNEKLERYVQEDRDERRAYGLARTPICDLTCTGEIYFCGCAIVKFRPQAKGYVFEGNFNFLVRGIEVSNETGLVYVTWNPRVPLHELKDSYVLMDYEVQIF